MSHIARFGIFELDLGRRELRRKGVQIKLQQQPFEILRLLVTHHGDLVTRERIQQTLWPAGHFVDFERSINTAVMRLRQALREDASAPAYIETVAGVGYRFIPPVVDDSIADGKSGIRSIAILPLQDHYGTPETEYFVSGLTDAIVTALALSSNLRVVSRARMSRYKDSPLNIRQIAREVDAQALVEGSILRSEERIRITLRMLDAREDRHLWAHTYERHQRDILNLEQEVADAIVRAVTNAGKKSSAAVPARQINPRAYELFLRGNFLLSGRNPKLVHRAAEHYENSIFLEPDWAPPIASLAECFRIQEFYNYPASQTLLARAKSLTEKALRIDPENAQANATSAALSAFNSWDWDAALERIRFAQRADPQSAHIEFIYSQIMVYLNRFDEALKHIDAALAIDPSSLLLWSYRAQILLLARRYTECIQESERLLEQNPVFAMALLNYAAALSECGRLRESLVAFDQVFNDTGWMMALIGRVYVRRLLGHSDELAADMELLRKHHRERVCSPGTLAWGYAVCGDRENALVCIDAAVAEHDSRLAVFFSLPQYDFLRDDDRFQSVLRQMRLKA